MASVPLIFTTSNLPAALAIRAVTWGSWSHVAILDERRQEVIEAVWPRVRVVALDEFRRRHPRHQVAPLPARSPQEVLAAARSQVGAPYDLTGVLGLGFRRDWQEDSAWWCSELAAWAFAAGGSPLFRADSLRRVTPQHLWMLAPAPPPPDPVLDPIEGRLVRPSSF